VTHVNLCPQAREKLEKVKEYLRRETGKEKISYSDTVFFLYKEWRAKSR
jgi:hypothetical protein